MKTALKVVWICMPTPLFPAKRHRFLPGCGIDGYPTFIFMAIIIVWEQWLENDRTEIRLLDFNNGLVRTVTSVRRSNTRPKIYGNYLFWTERVTCDAINLGNLGARAQAGAFVYNLDTGTKRRISNHSEPQVRVHGNLALISEGCQYQTSLYAVFL